MKSLRILIADNHDIVRRSVRAALESEPDWSPCGETKSGLETLTKTIELMPDIVILDVGLPGLNGVEVTREICRVAPTVQVVVLTMHRSRQLERHLYDAGASAYLAKADLGRTLVETIAALTGERAVNGGAMHAGMGEWHDADAGASGGSGGNDRHVPLTAREREVMRLLAEGRSHKEIGTALTISAKTVETHRARIMNKLGLHSMNQLVRYAIRRRIISA
jgi:DNA-binding NarL/FixJ family response regulator